MTQMISRICYDQAIPPHLLDKAAQKAIAENPANKSIFEAAVETSKLWKPGRTLRVRFLDGEEQVQKKVAHFAQQWAEFANITFAFGEDPKAEIRISFREAGSWSALGTDCLVAEWYPLSKATMNFGWLMRTSTDREYSSVVLHEFGHALGMIHEHQTPAEGIQWNREAVIRDLSQPPNSWDEETIQFNVLDRYNRSQTQFSKFDPQSIMLYAFPSHWTLNGLTFAENSVLSQTDKDFIKMIYPR